MTLIYRVCRDLAYLGYKAYGRVRVVGLSRVPRTGPVILASNHVSFLDPPLVGSCVRRECAFMARHDLWKSRLLGWLITRLNSFPVHRDTADRAAIRQACDALGRGLALVMFPEGTRSPDGILRDAEAGIALIVQKSGAPVVPVAVIGPERMMPPGAHFPRPTRLTVVFGEPLLFGKQESREAVVGRIMRAIALLLSEHGRPEAAAPILAEATVD